MWILARFNVFIGKDYFYDLYTRYTYGAGQGFRPEQDFIFIETAAVVLLYTSLEFWFWLNSSSAVSRKDFIHGKARDDVVHEDIIKCLNQPMLRRELDKRFGDKLIMMFLNRIYDLSNFTHPGGQYIWEWSRWRETSRYLVGAYGDEKDYYDQMDYNHSMDAYKMLDKCFIGR